MLVIDALKWANDQLKSTDIDSPMLDAEVLLAEAMDTPKSWLFSHFNILCANIEATL